MGNTFDFDMMLSSAREAYGEELYKMACEGLDFVFTYSDNVAPSSSAGKLLREFPERCFNTVSYTHLDVYKRQTIS